MKHFQRIRRAVFLSVLMLTAWMLPLLSGLGVPAAAISTDYPMQLMNIASKNNSGVLTETGTADGAALTVKALGGDLAPSWRFDWVGTDANGSFFKLCNAESGRLLTPQGYTVKDDTNVIMYGSESAQSQHWYVIPVQQDRLGNDLYYKIVNYSDTSLALTQGAAGMTLSAYTGADSQLWLLNADGLQGFAGYCKDDNTGKIKASDIGGLFGEIVEATTFDELKKYATSDTPYTIVVTKNISVSELNMNGSRYMCSAGRIYVHNNKTIIGSYGAHTLFNVQFCTSSNSGVGNNIIIKNFDMQHDAESNNNDSIVCYFGAGENIWVDHVTFTGHNNYGHAPKTGEVDEDKFLACCYDADYCTVSDCSFGAHKYGLILGYPADDPANQAKYGGYPRMSLISNKFNDTNTRGPGLMRWGYFHSLNNYVNKFSMAYTVISDCHIFAENCTYENGGNVICDWDKVALVGEYSETGSKFSGCNRTKQGGDSNSTAVACAWRPSSNYGYVSLSADAAKQYCSSYSGCQSKTDSVMYLRYAKSGVPSAGFNTAPSEPNTPSAPTPAELPEGVPYRLQNVNSGLYMQIEGGKAENGANIQQWGSDGTSLHDIWTLISAGDGYYYIASALDNSFVLDVAGKKADNGTNIDLYQLNSGTNQQFMFTENSDGSYKIRTRVSGEASAVEIVDGLTSAGANVQEWEINGANCQDWMLVPAVLPMNGRLVRNLVTADADNSAAWGIADAAANGDTVFGDRDFTYLTMPAELVGAERIVTACDSKYFADDLASFTVSADVTVFVALDSRVEPVPAWLSAYQKTDLTLTTSNDVILHVYAMEMKAGNSVTLGANEVSANAVCYTVFVQEAKQLPPPVIGDVNADGTLNTADLVLIQKWLLTVPDTALADWEAADLDGNGKLNANDLALMKQFLLLFKLDVDIVF